ncbi:MAG TPA: T9SS type A sorting domain-containing protein [Flavobacterium sp.]|nr:T9SS type A sorting domain-containing protein [Flavobacterium sp.]
MKKLFLLFFVSNFAFAQDGVQIRLVNEAIGAESLFNWGGSTELTNDADLNTILSNYGAYWYQSKGGNFGQLGNYPIQIGANGNLNQLVADLQAYSTVIAYAHLADVGYFSDQLEIVVNNAVTGIPVGMNNGIIVTNDAGLNQIFEDFNVSKYGLLYPDSTEEPAPRFYGSVCDCDINLLKTTLDNYAAVIESTSLTYAVYLANEKFNIKETAIYPNPFTSTITIDAPGKITSYDLTDATGKQIIHTNSKAILDVQTVKLATGAYVLSLQFENGQNGNFKLLKK